MVADVAIGPANSNITTLTNVNGSLYFFANDGATGRELWKAAGSFAGAVLVKDIHSGPASSRRGDPAPA